VGVDVQYARDSDANLLSTLHQRDPLFGRLVPELCNRDRICHALGIGGAEDFLRGDVHEVRVSLPELIEACLDVLHVVDIFDESLLASGDDQALLAVHQRDFCDFLDWYEGQRIGLRDFGCTHIDESTQAIVLTEIAARGFVARGTVLDFADRLKAYKASDRAVAPQANGFGSRADRA